MENLKIELFKQELSSVISKSPVPLGITLLILKELENEIFTLYQRSVNEEYQQYIKEHEQQNKEEEEKKGV